MRGPRRDRAFDRPRNRAGRGEPPARLVDHRRSRRRGDDLRLELRGAQQHRPPQPQEVHRRPQRQRDVHLGEHRVPHELAQAGDHASRVHRDGRPHEEPVQESAHGRTDVQPRQEVQYRPHGPHPADNVLDRDGVPVPGPGGRPRLQAARGDPPAGQNANRLGAPRPRGHPQGPRLRARRGRPGQVPSAKLAAWGTHRERPPTRRSSPRPSRAS